MVMPMMPPPGAMTPIGMMGAPPPMAPPMAPPMNGPVGAPGAILDADYRLLVADAERNAGPTPPPWYIPTSAPKADDVMAEAQTQQQAHAQRVLRQAWMELRLGMEITSIFANDELYVSLQEIEPQPSQLLRLMHDAIINFVASQTIQYASLAQGIVNREERTAIEGHLADVLRDAKECAFREGQGSFIRTLTADALNGMAAIYHAPDPSNQRVGQRIYRVDPKVVFPIFGRDGLDRVYTLYDAAYPEVLRDFGDGVDERGHPNPATSAIQKIARKGGGRGKRDFDMETRHEVTGYWDREYGLVLWKGEVIREWRHKLWVCPWHIGVPNWRQQAGAKSRGGFAVGGDRPGPLIDVDGVSTPYEGVNWAAGNRQLDLARMYEPFLTPWNATADKIEKTLTRTGYALDRALDNPLYWKRSSANSEPGTPEIQNFRRGVTEGQEDEELDILPMNPLGDSFAPWLSMLQIEMQASIPSPILQGQNIGTQASGNALDVIAEMGYAHFAPVVEFMPMLFQEVGHRTLIYKRDFAPAYDPDNPVSSRQGFTAYGNNAQGSRQAVKLTKEMLQRSGCYVECTMSRFSLAGMTAAATTAATIDQQLHLGTRRYWIERFGMSTNPQQLEDDRRDQDMEDAPGYVEALQVEHLYDQMVEAAELDDDESLGKLKSRAKRVAAKQYIHDVQIAKMAGIMAGQPEPMAGELPGDAGVEGSGNPMPYLSAPEVGRETGTEGGAPTQAAPPPIPG